MTEAVDAVDMHRVERALDRQSVRIEQVVDTVARIDTKVAVLDTKVDAAAITALELARTRAEFNAHTVADAGTHAKLTANIDRLWWGIGIVMSGVVATLIAVLREGAS